MDFTVSCKVLRQKLEAFVGAVASKTARPDLTGFFCFINANSNVLHIHASDVEVFLTGEVEVSNVNGFGVFCLPSQLLLRQLRLLPEQPLTFHVNLETLEVTVDYDNGHFSFYGENPMNYPELPALDKVEGGFSVSAKELNNALSKVLSSVANDILRPVLSGVYFDFKPSGLNLVASNGQRLALAGIPSSGENSGCSFVLIARSVALLQKQLNQEEERVTVQFDDLNVFIQGKGFHMVSRLTLGRFPNYQRVIPDGDANLRGVNRSWLISAIRRTSSFSLTSNVSKLSLDSGLLTVSCDDDDNKSYSTEQLELDYYGPHLEVSFRTDYLVDYLNKIDGDKVDMLIGPQERLLPVRIEPSRISEDLSMRFIVIPSAC